MIITTSWDDGHPLDSRLAERLARYGLPGTFYIPLANNERPVMPRAEIRRLAEAGFEIGGHTLNHVRLTGVSPDLARREIVGCREELESIVGCRVRSFSYVGGEHSPALAALVRQAGFEIGRTTVLHRVWHPKRPPGRYFIPVSVWVKNLNRRDDLYQFGYWRNWQALPGLLGARPRRFVEQAECLLAEAQACDGVFHLWGHSWEMEQHNLWADLERVLARLAETKGHARWLKNGELPLVGPEAQTAR